MKKLNNLILILIFLFLTPISIHSQESSESSKVDKNEIKEILKERLDKANPELLGVNTENSNKLYAHFGTVTEIAKSYLILETNDKKRVEVKLDPNTELSLYVAKGKPNLTITPDKIESGWFAIAMGIDYQENSLKATRISLSKENLSTPEKKTIVGKVKEVEDVSLTIINEQEIKLTIPQDYNLAIKDVKKPTLEDINIDDKIIAIVQIDKDKEERTIYTIKSMYLIPSIKNPKAADNTVDESTKSAEATKSALKASPKPKN